MNHFELIRLAVGDKRLNGRDLKVLMYILSKVPKSTFQSFICRDELSEATHIQKNYISKHTARLSEFGWIKKEGNGGRSSFVLYQILPQETSTESVPVIEDIKSTENVPQTKERGTESVPKGVQKVYKRGTESVRGKKEPHKEPHKEPQKDIQRKKKFLIPDDWKPSERCFGLIEEKNINLDFAKSLISEFIFYWSEQREKRPGWDTTFLNHVKRQWGRNQNEINNGNSKITGIEKHSGFASKDYQSGATDTSVLEWAN